MAEVRMSGEMAPKRRKGAALILPFVPPSPLDQPRTLPRT